MSLDSDSDADVSSRGGRQQQRGGGQRRAHDDSSEDDYDDIFKPKRKAPVKSIHDDADSFESSLPPPRRSYVCDECESAFTEAVFCGECAMTYCEPCDARYHSGGDELGLREHFRQPLHGEVPRDIRRHMDVLVREEEEEAREQMERMTRPSDYRDESPRAHDGTLRHTASTSNMPPATSFNYDYAGLPPAPIASPVEAAGGPTSPLRRSASHSARASAASIGYSGAMAYAAPAAMPLSPTARGGWFDAAAASSPTAATLQRTAVPKPRRAQSASARGSDAVPRTTMVLKSSRPSVADSAGVGAASLRTSSSVRMLPTRMRVASAAPTLSGKTAVGRNMLLHQTGSAMIHQMVPKRKQSTAGERGAHAAPHRWGDAPPSAAQLRDLNDQILRLKGDITSMESAKSQYKTTVLKKQRALKEIARIAHRLARQPTVASGLSSHAGAGTTVARKSPSADITTLNERIASVRASNEILRLECEEVSTRLRVLRDSADLANSGAKELAQLQRERRDLIKQVSIDAAGRDLDAFKKSQLLADLEFTCEEMRRATEEKKSQAAEQKMQRLTTENETRRLQQEYDRLQAKIDRWAAREVAGYQ